MRTTIGDMAARFLPGRLSARADAVAARIDRIMHGTGTDAAAERIALTAFVVRILSAGIALVSQVILARLMGVFEYGIFVFVWTAMLIAGNLTCLGFQTSVIRFIPQYRESGDLEALRGIHSASRWSVIASSSLAALIAAGAMTAFSDHIPVFYVEPLWLALILLPLIAIGDLMSGTARAQGWAMMAMTPVFIVRPLLILAFLIVALLVGNASSGMTALACAVAATAVTSLGTLFLTVRGVSRTVPSGPSRVSYRMWLTVSLPIFLVEGFYYILTNADVLMVGFFMTPEDVAVYFAAVKILALVHFVYFAVRAGAAQRFASLLHGGSTSDLHDFARTTVKWTFWPSLAMAGLLILVGDMLLALFGAQFVNGHGLMAILCAGVVARAAVGPAEALLTMAGHERICALAYGLALAANVSLNFGLIPEYGLMGAAIATAIAMTLEATLLCLIVRRRVGVTMLVGFGSSGSGA